MLSMLNRPTGLSQQMLPFKNMANMVRNASNPQVMLSQIMKNNPNYAQAMRLIEENGGDAKAAFYKRAQEMGVNPDEVLSFLG